MNGQNRNDDSEIGAWLDGELDRDGMAAMARQATTDDDLAARSMRLRRIDDLVREAVPKETGIPPELLERVGLAEPRSSAPIFDLADARRARADLRAPVQPSGRRRGLQRIAATVALVLGLGLATTLWLVPGEKAADTARYRTLNDQNAPADAADESANALLIFAADTDPASARRIAQAAGADLVGEPNAAGAWKARIAPIRRDAVLGALRRDHRVTLAEPIDGSEP